MGYSIFLTTIALNTPKTSPFKLSSFTPTWAILTVLPFPVYDYASVTNCSFWHIDKSQIPTQKGLCVRLV